MAQKNPGLPRYYAIKRIRQAGVNIRQTKGQKAEGDLLSGRALPIMVQDEDEY